MLSDALIATVAEVVPVILVGLVIVVVVVAAIIHARRKARERTEALAAMAASSGLAFDAEHRSISDTALAEIFATFRQGDTRRVYNTMRGHMTVGNATRGVQMGDYRYTVTQGSGKNRRRVTYRFSYLLVHMDVTAPELIIRAETFLDKIGAFFGFDDIDFESVEFSKRFSVKGTNKRFAWDLIDPRVMEWLLTHDDPPLIELDGEWMLIARKSTWSPAEFMSHVDFAGTFMAHWPDHTVSTLRDGGYSRED